MTPQNAIVVSGTHTWDDGLHVVDQIDHLQQQQQHDKMIPSEANIRCFIFKQIIVMYIHNAASSPVGEKLIFINRKKLVVNLWKSCRVLNFHYFNPNNINPTYQGRSQWSARIFFPIERSSSVAITPTKTIPLLRGFTHRVVSLSDLWLFDTVIHHRPPPPNLKIPEYFNIKI